LVLPENLLMLTKVFFFLVELPYVNFSSPNWYSLDHTVSDVPIRIASGQISAGQSTLDFLIGYEIPDCSLISYHFELTDFSTKFANSLSIFAGALTTSQINELIANPNQDSTISNIFRFLQSVPIEIGVGKSVKLIIKNFCEEDSFDSDHAFRR
jgi:hypothetical protein